MVVALVRKATALTGCSALAIQAPANQPSNRNNINMPKFFFIGYLPSPFFDTHIIIRGFVRQYKHKSGKGNYFQFLAGQGFQVIVMRRNVIVSSSQSTASAPKHIPSG